MFKLKNEPGIYKVINKATGNFYVGKSKSILKRFYDHKNAIKSGKHINAKINEDVEKYGLEAFDFEVIEYCSVEQLNQKEIDYIYALLPYYNKFGKPVKPKTNNQKDMKQVLVHLPSHLNTLLEKIQAQYWAQTGNKLTKADVLIKSLETFISVSVKENNGK